MVLTPEQTIQIANYCLSCEEGKQSPLPSDIAEIQINKISITEIMALFSIVWKAPETWFEGNDESEQIIKRKLKKSLRIIYESGLLKTINSENGCQEDVLIYNDARYDEILKQVENIYGGTQYDFSQEAFWLITGYAPPYNYIPAEKRWDLYACCFYDLHKMWYRYHQLLKHNSPRYCPEIWAINGFIEQNECAIFGTQLGIGIEVHKDILKARHHLADKWDKDREQRFLKKLPAKDTVATFHSKEIYRYLLSFVDEMYEEVATSKTSFKSLKYAPDILYANLLDECFILTERHLYQEVFEVIAAISRVLWPL